ncbi:hypothetical protein GGF32_000480 [Allomyces javanicus]|nr:hypothetical protein GGF32_000480 [Allomyces javanicus]
MSTTTQPDVPPYPPALPAAQSASLRDQAVDWALAHGLVIRSATTPTSSVVHAPFALFPSPFPRSCFTRARDLAPAFNRLVHAVTKDGQFLRAIMDEIGDVDPFTHRLYQIYLAQRAAKDTVQPITLGVYRSDYLLHRDIDPRTKLPAGDFAIHQVELNTIASSFGCLSTHTAELHRYLLSKTDFYSQRTNPATHDINASALPDNRAMQSIARGLAEAHTQYGRKEAVVVMVVQPGERNAFDQRWLEYELIDSFGIKLVRRTLAELHSGAQLDKDRRLFIGTLAGRTEVAVVYYRAGYGPGDYPTETEWAARAMLDRSWAVQCPTVAQQLAGAKKVQQVLAAPGMLERFVDKTTAADLRQCFTGLYPLTVGTPEGDAAYARALADPARYVLKPQREGGGHNYYGDDIPRVLKAMPARERAAYILMDLIRPPPLKNVLVRDGKDVEADVVSELGVYGIWVAVGDKEVINEAGGHLLRTKASSTNEGGVAAGFAVLDSPLLF